MVTVSNQAERLVAFTWHESTYSLIGNPRHPCMHADPSFPDIPPGQTATIRGQPLKGDRSLNSVFANGRALL